MEAKAPAEADELMMSEERSVQRRKGWSKGTGVTQERPYIRKRGHKSRTEEKSTPILCHASHLEDRGMHSTTSDTAYRFLCRLFFRRICSRCGPQLLLSVVPFLATGFESFERGLDLCRSLFQLRVVQIYVCYFGIHFLATLRKDGLHTP